MLNTILWSVLFTAWGAFFLVLALRCYGLLCAKTAKWQRKRIEDFRKGKSNLGWDSLYDEFQQVTFQQHTNSLGLLRNPIKLYGELTQKMWEKTYG